MTDENALDEGLAAFDRMGREMAETNRLLRSVRSDQATRNQQEAVLSSEMQKAVRQATGAAQKALQASQTEIRSNLLWLGCIALVTVLGASGLGYVFGLRSGQEQGQAEGYMAARDEKAAASWANTPAGLRAFEMEKSGNLDMVTLCKGEGWQIQRQHGKPVCFPFSNTRGEITGWEIP